MIDSVSELIKMQEETFNECQAILKKKNHDYSSGSGGGSPFSNFEASSVLGVDPVIGILMRSMDKFKRVETFVKKGELLVEGEGVEDAFNDVINYMILGKGMILNKIENNQIEEVTQHGGY